MLELKKFREKLSEKQFSWGAFLLECAKNFTKGFLIACRAFALVNKSTW